MNQHKTLRMVIRPSQWFALQQIFHHSQAQETIAKVNQHKTLRRLIKGHKMLLEKDNYYHLFNRGCNKEAIFRDEYDYQKLLMIIRKSNFATYIELCAFSFMPNHYHFLVKQKTKQHATKWIKYVFNCYSQYFNHKYNRSGTLFEGRVKTKIINKVDYLERIVHYIHNNPTNDFLKKYCSISYLQDETLISNAFYNSFFNNVENYMALFKEYDKNELVDGISF